MIGAILYEQCASEPSGDCRPPSWVRHTAGISVWERNVRLLRREGVGAIYHLGRAAPLGTRACCAPVPGRGAEYHVGRAAGSTEMSRAGAEPGEWIADAEEARRLAPEVDRWLLLPAHQVLNQAALQGILRVGSEQVTQCAGRREVAARTEGDGRQAPAGSPPAGGLLEGAAPPPDGDGRLSAVALVIDPEFASPTQAPASAPVPIAWFVAAGALPSGAHLPACTPDRSFGCVRTLLLPPHAVCVQLRTEADLEVAEECLLAAQRSNTDGWVDRALHRPLSRALCRRLVRTGITPNQVTGTHIALGGLGALCIASGSHAWSIAGAFLLQVSVLLDCTDGDIARLKLDYSPVGGWLDTIGDNLVNAALFVALGVAAQDRLGPQAALGLGVLAGVGVALAAGTVGMLTFWQRARRRAGLPAGFSLSPVAANLTLMNERALSLPPQQQRFDAWLAQLTSRDFTVLVLAAALFDRPDALLWLAAVGVHVFWVGFLAVQLRMMFWTPEAAAGHGKPGAGARPTYGPQTESPAVGNVPESPG